MTFTAFVHAHLRALVCLAYVALAWVVANYLSQNDPVVSEEGDRPQLRRLWVIYLVGRSLLAGACTFFAAGSSIGVGVYTTVCALAFSALRTVLPRKLHAETEFLGNGFFFAGFLGGARWLNLHPPAWGVGGFEPGHVAAVLLIVSVVIYVESGGTNIVRGLLEKGRVLPRITPPPSVVPAPRLPETPETASRPLSLPLLPGPEPVFSSEGMAAKADENKTQRVDTDEYNHGRLIGNSERLLLMALVAIQAYQALAFLMAAKGLFRAKELESRNFSEYFLVGTLVSSVVAVAAGLLIQMIIKLCW